MNEEEIIKNLNINGKHVLEYIKETKWKERRIMVIATAICMIIISIALCICAYKTDNHDVITNTITITISSILSFFAGRITQNDKEQKKR